MEILKMAIEIVDFPLNIGDFPYLCQFARGYIRTKKKTFLLVGGGVNSKIRTKTKEMMTETSSNDTT